MARTISSTTAKITVAHHGMANASQNPVDMATVSKNEFITESPSYSCYVPVLYRSITHFVFSMISHTTSVNSAIRKLQLTVTGGLGRKYVK